MTTTETTTILRQYREWLCDTPKSVRPHTRQINEAIDAAVEMIDRLEAAEKDIALKERVIDTLGSELNAVAKERDELRAKIEAVHSILDSDESRIIRNAKDGYPEGCEPKELTLTERVTALCKYAADWKRWLGESESKIKEMEQQKPIAEWIENRFHRYPQLNWADGYRAVIGEKLYALPGAKGE